MLWMALGVTAAFADIGPIHPERRCGAAVSCPGGLGVDCQTSVEAPAACQAFAAQGYTYACRHGVGAVWTEAWCGGDVVAGRRPVAAPAAPPAAAPPVTPPAAAPAAVEPASPPAAAPAGAGCGCAQGVAGSLSLALGLAGVALVLQRRGSVG
jgi:hypothetical protein